MPSGYPKNGINKGWFRKGEHPSSETEFKKGHKLKHSEETKIKIGLANKGKKRSEEDRLRLRVMNKGKKLSEDHKRKISESSKGRIGYWKGKHIPEETKVLISLNSKGEKSHCWAGDSVGYSGVHKWVYLMKGKAKKCTHCETKSAKRYEWANIDHKYRRVLIDYMEVCVKCHRKYDKQLNPEIS